MEFKVTQKFIRQYDKRDVFFERLKAWQNKNNTTGLCSAYDLGLKRIAYSIGVYGLNGTLYQDIRSGEYIGVPTRSYNIYVD